ncbi:MAG: hypothetical protein ACRDA3_07850 [Peptostreptococcaceae bacterium]
MYRLIEIIIGAFIIFTLSEISYIFLGSRFIGIAIGTAIASQIRIKSKLKSE